MNEILEDYPNIAKEDILAALEFGAKLSAFETNSYETTTI